MGTEPHSLRKINRAPSQGLACRQFLAGISNRLQFLENFFSQAYMSSGVGMQGIALQFRIGKNVGNRVLDQRDVLRNNRTIGEQSGTPISRPVSSE